MDRMSTMKVLNHLIERCLDSQHSYALASRGMNDPLLKAELLQYSFQRQRFANQLTEAVWDAGLYESGDGEDSNRAQWLEIRKALERSDQAALLEACQRAEEQNARSYLGIEYGILPNEVATMVQSQSAAISRVNERLKILRETVS